MDGDGTPDLLVGAPNASGNQGRAALVSGASGAVLRTLTSPNAQADGFFGFSVAGPGDLDGDGTPDLVVGATDEEAAVGGAQVTDQGQAHAFSGADGSALWSGTPRTAEGAIFFGRVAALGGDATGDGVPDVIAGAVRARAGGQRSGRAYLLSGADGSVVYALDSVNAQDNGFFGHTLAGVPDLDGDGVPEVLVGSPFETVFVEASQQDLLRAGTIHLFSGADGSLLSAITVAGRQNTSPQSNRDGDSQFFGQSLAVFPDVSGDGLPEIAVGAPTQYNADVSGPPSLGDRFTGGVFVLDGGALARGEDPIYAEVYPVLNGPVNPRIEWGYAVAALDDVDGDGVPDLAVGAPGSGIEIGQVSVVSGATIRSVSHATPVAEADLGIRNTGSYAFDGTGLSVDVAIQNPFDRQLPAVPYTARFYDTPPVRQRADALDGLTPASYRWVLTRRDRHPERPRTTFRVRLADVPDNRVTDPEAVTVFYRSAVGGEFRALSTSYDAASGELVASLGTGAPVGEVALAGPGLAVDAAAGPEGAAFELSAWPNPTARGATVALALDAPGDARVAVFDALGRRVAVLHDGPLAAGEHAFGIDARALAPGLYVVRAVTAAGAASRTLSVVR